MINGVILDRQRAMTALVLHFELKVYRHLFAGLHTIKKAPAISLTPATAFVQTKLCVNQVAMILQQPIGAIKVDAFLVSSKRHDNVSIRIEAFLFVAAQVRDE